MPLTLARFAQRDEV